MKSYTYTAFDGHPDHGGEKMPPLVDRRIKTKDRYNALVKAQYFTERHVKSCCEPTTKPRRYWVSLRQSGEQIELGFIDTQKGKQTRYSPPQHFVDPQK